MAKVMTRNVIAVRRDTVRHLEGVVAVRDRLTYRTCTGEPTRRHGSLF
jgi:hypothetical protein